MVPKGGVPGWTKRTSTDDAAASLRDLGGAAGEGGEALAHGVEGGGRAADLLEQRV
jgi:hypothetical protein